MSPMPREGFEAFYAQSHRGVVASMIVTFGDVDVATDATDEAFARALAKWDRVGRMDSPAGWTYRVALNVGRRRRRRQMVEGKLLATRAVPAEVPPHAAIELEELLAHLPPRQRSVMILRFVGDLTEVEIAKALHVSRSTVSSALADAKRNLAAATDESNVGDLQWRPSNV